MLGSGMIGSRILLGVLVLAGCATPRLVPLPDGVVIDRELGSAARTQQGVTVTVRASAWRGRSDVERYVTPLYVAVENHTLKGVSFRLSDLVLFDERRTQYNPLAPESVVQIIQGDVYSELAYAPFFTPFFATSRLGLFHPLSHLHDPFFLRWVYMPPLPTRPDHVVTGALIAGTVRPNARVHGFVYFTKLPRQVESVGFQIGYEVEGEPGRPEMEFRFALDPPQTWKPSE